MSLTCENVIFSDFTRKKKFASENGGGGGGGWRPLSPCSMALIIKNKSQQLWQIISNYVVSYLESHFEENFP